MENKISEESKGLGDTIAKVTHALKLDVLAEKVAHAMDEEDCGCNRRREKLNELFPYKKKDKNQQ
jgi:hypothetical protein